MTQHINDRLQISSLTPDAVKHANKIQGISRWLVLGKTLAQNLTSAAARGASSRPSADGAGSEAEVESLLVAKAAALERTMLLFKVLGNLHFWCEDLGQAAKGQFVKYLVGSLRAIAVHEHEFKSLCLRVGENLKALLRFLDPVSPDEDTKEEEEGDILLTEVGTVVRTLMQLLHEQHAA